jgi:hypothetical protein
MLTQDQRDQAVSVCRLLNQYAEAYGYIEERPMPTRHLTIDSLRHALLYAGGAEDDCSGTVTLIARLSGWKDPNGLDYNGDGYTGTMFDYLQHMSSVEDLHKGGLIIYSSGGKTVHVVMVVQQNGTDPEIYSHGSHARSAIWSLGTEDAYHPGASKTYCAVGKL